MKKQTKADIALLFVTIGWGTSFLLTKESISQMPTYNFHNPTYKVYDLSGNLVSNSLSFNFSITNPTKLIIKRQLEVNGVILPSINSILCEGIDTVELIPGPQSVSMIQIIQPAICKNNLISAAR
mgnify:CR=1 FL=1